MTVELLWKLAQSDSGDAARRLPMSQTAVENLAVPELDAPLSLALRNILITAGLTILSLAIAGLIWREQGYEMLIVTMGWPHVILGFLFYFGRVMRGEANARSAFVLLALLTLTFWTIHYSYAITGLIYLYFLYHAFRDEIFVYLQTRARHRPGKSVYAVAGVGPAILLMLLVPQQQDFRQDLRRAEFTEAQVAGEGMTLIPFKPVPNSRGRDFYFALLAPHTAGVRTFTTSATTADSRTEGDVLVNDLKWSQAADLVFHPHYSDEANARVNRDLRGNTIPVLLTGGHRVGQTFRAEQNNLDGIWLPISRLEVSTGTATQFSFHLASPPLLPYPSVIAAVRFGLIVLLGILVVWKLLPRRGKGNQLWIYLLVIAGGFAFTQGILKSSNAAGYALPMIFQFVVVFHYWSWYVFSADKFRTLRNSAHKPNPKGSYDRILALLRSPRPFTIVVILLNVVSAVGVFWYYKLGGPMALRFAFDYNYFLYFLVFHVTFSFSPKAPNRVALTESRAVAT